MAAWMGEKYLAAQLQSFVKQTRLPDELVVRDDGSTDQSLAILQRFAETAPFPVRILPTGPRLGYAKNFEAVLQEARGDLIFLSDQDDVWFPNRLEKVARFATSYPDKLIFINNQEIVDETLRPTGVTKLDNLRRSGVSTDRYISGCATALRRSLQSFALPFPQDLRAHDQWLHECGLWLKARMLIDDPLQYYRRHGENASSTAISHPRPTRWITAQLHTLTSDTLQSYRQWLLIAEALRDRISSSPELVHQLCAEDPSILLQSLGSRIQSLQGRLRVLEAPWFSRPVQAMAFWSKGGYREFFGWRSMLNDLLTRSAGHGKGL